MSDSVNNLLLNVARTAPYALYEFGILQSLVTQDWTGIYFTGGLFLFGDLLNGFILKPTFQYFGSNVQEFKRPSMFGTGDGCEIYPFCNIKDLKHSWGMPSGHSQMMAIFATFWVCYLLKYFQNAEPAGLYISIVIIILIALLVILSRLYVKCHNLLQVTAGTLIGIGLGYLLFYIYTLLR
jgi:membrane-associated phospholipid phosphatase